MPQAFVLTCCYNSAEWIAKCCQSVIEQSFQDWKMVVVDDASGDGTADLVPSDPRITLIRNRVRSGKLANLVKVLGGVGEESVVAIVDGDDWLKHDGVLAEVIPWYESYDLVWTLYQDFPSHKPWHEAYGLTPNEGRPPRKWPWRACHLGTFRKYLFDKIIESDLMMDGGYFKAATDAALFLPMLEMTDGEVAKRVHIPEPMYVYNRTNPNSHGIAVVNGKYRVNHHLSQVQKRCMLEVKKRFSYSALES